MIIYTSSKIANLMKALEYINVVVLFWGILNARLKNFGFVRKDSKYYESTNK